MRRPRDIGRLDGAAAKALPPAARPPARGYRCPLDTLMQVETTGTPKVEGVVQKVVGSFAWIKPHDGSKVFKANLKTVRIVPEEFSPCTLTNRT